jgi:hypothetical protein
VGVTTFLDHRFQGGDVQRLVGHDVFQAPVFVLELSHAFGFIELEPAKFRSPPVVRGFVNAMGTAELVDRPARFAFVKDLENLLVGESTPSHASPLGNAARVTV